MADTLIFKLRDAVAPLPGSASVRKMIVDDGLAYLERLSGEAGHDRDLQLKMARAYIKIGSVQGRPNEANLGDTEGALSSFRRAESTRSRPAAADLLTGRRGGLAVETA